MQTFSRSCVLLLAVCSHLPAHTLSVTPSSIRTDQTADLILANGSGEAGGCVTNWELLPPAPAGIVQVQGPNPLASAGQYTNPSTSRVTFKVTPLRAGVVTLALNWSATGGQCNQPLSQRVSTILTINEAPPQPLTCNSAALAPGIRAEGLTELTGDIVINCQGGGPSTPSIANLDLTANVPTLLRDGGGGLLLTGEPTIQNARLGNNTFQPLQISNNNLIWQGIPFDPPGTTSSRIFRITNVRVNANQLGIGSGGLQLTPRITTSSGGILYSGSLLIPVLPGATFSTNQVEAAPVTSTLGRPFSLRFSEAFATSFKTRCQPPLPTAPAAASPGCEEGLVAPPVTQSITTQHTRLIARFNKVPSGVQLWVDTSAAAQSASVQLVNPVPPSGATTMEIPLVNGSGTAIWEVIQQNPAGIDTLDIPYSVRSTGPPLPGVVFVTGGLSGNDSIFGLSPDPPVFPYVAPVSPQQWNLNAFPAAQFYNPADPPALHIVNPNGPVDIIRLNGFSGNDDFLIGDTSANVILFQATGPANFTFTPRVGVQPQISKERSAEAGWLSVTVDRTRTPAAVTVKVAPSARLAPGTYSGNVDFTSAGVAPVTIPVQLTVAGPGPRFQKYGVVHAGSYLGGVVAPGEAVVVFGSNYGPPSIVGLKLDVNGVTETGLGETRVLFDDVPAPMIYAASGQVSCFVPFSVAGKAFTRVQVEYRGVKSPAVEIPVIDAAPGLFAADASGSGQGAILNQDSSVNTPQNPAAPGDVVVLYGTGAGQTTPGGRDGYVTSAPVPEFRLQVKVSIDGREAEVAYGGPAPGQIEGVFQVNAKVPTGVRSGNVPVRVRIGDKISQDLLTLAVR